MTTSDYKPLRVTTSDYEPDYELLQVTTSRQVTTGQAMVKMQQLVVKRIFTSYKVIKLLESARFQTSESLTFCTFTPL